ncbi:MAG: hypothetical protein OXJ55_14250 [Caldilineaceae bacterium]|nr:hypothetical protein [Caldilineaceae bacterium]
MTVLFDNTLKNTGNVSSEYAEVAQSPLSFMMTVRNTLEEWFTHYPQDQKKEFRNRFSGDNVSYRGALLELVVHEILRNYAGNVQHEVELPSGRKPDFHLKTPEKRKLWVECTVAQRSNTLKASIAIAKRLQEAVNSIDTSPFGLDWTVLRHLSQTPPGENRLKCHIQKFVLKLNQEILGRSVVEGRFVGETLWEDRGWTIRFGAFYLPSLSSNDPSIVDDEGENAGVNENNDGWLESDPKKLRPPLEKKASQLKSAAGSSIIVLSHADFIMDNTDKVFELALFGDSNTGDSRDSFFGTADSPNNRNVSGVLYFPLIKAQMFCSRETPWLYVPHPWSNSPLSEDIFSFARRGAFNSAGVLKWRPSLCTLNDVLGLPEDWPGIPDKTSPC